MFCQNCGAPNDDDAVFCGSCGTKLDKSDIGTTDSAQQSTESNVQTANVSESAGQTNAKQQMNPVQQTNTMQQASQAQQADNRQQTNMSAKAPVVKKPIPKQLIIMLAEIVALVAVVIGIIMVGNKSFSAERTAEQYFINVANGDWESAYEQLDIEESEFINAKMFAKANAGNSLGMINTYAVSKPESELDEFMKETLKLGKDVIIKYRLKGDEYDSSYSVAVSKQPEKKFGFFESWKVGSSSLICEEYTITVPKGAVVTLDGITLGEKHLANEDELDVYVVSKLFRGNHEIQISLADYEEVSTKVSVMDSYDSYYLDYMVMKKEVIENLMKQAVSDMQEIYAAAKDGKNLNTIEKKFTTDEEYKEDITKSYDDLLSYFNENDYEPQQIEFTNIKAAADGTVIRVYFDYAVQYTYEDWWTGEEALDVYSSYEECDFRYVKEGDTWVLTNLGCGRLYY